MSRRRNSKAESIAFERVEKLLDLASSIFEKNPDLANRYTELAWNIKTRYNLRLPFKLKRKFCRKCRAFWVPNETCRVRLRSSPSPHIVITCLNCGHERRIPYKG